MDRTERVYRKGELVPGPGTYRCVSCGEVWTTDEKNVRFPPCDASKTGEDGWVQVSDS